MKSINSNIPQLVSLIEEKWVYIKKLIGWIVLSVAWLLHAENTIASNIEFYLTNSSATGTSKVGKLNDITTATGWKLIVTDQANKLVTNKLVAFTTPYGTLTIDTLYVAGVPNPNLGNFTFSLATQSVAFLNSLPTTITIPITYRTIDTKGTMLLHNDVINLNKATLTQNPTNGIINVDMNYADVELTNNVLSGILPEITTNTKQVLKYGAWVMPTTSKGSLDLAAANQGYWIYGYNAPVKAGDPTKLDYTITGKQTHKYTVTDSIDWVNTGTAKVGTIVVNIINGKPTESLIGQRTFVTNKNSILNGSVLVNNPEKKEALTYTTIVPPLLGNVAVATDGKFLYTPNNNATGNDTTTVRVTDQAWQYVDTSLQITITENESPIGLPHGYSGYVSRNKSGKLTALDNNAGDTLTFTRISQSAWGNLVISPDGTFTFTPTPGYYGKFTAQYQVTDQLGATSNIATITIDVYDTILISWSQPTQRENWDALTISEIGWEEIRYIKLSNSTRYQYINLPKDNALKPTDPASDPTKNILRYYNEHIENGSACYRIVSSNVALPLDINTTTVQIAAYDTNWVYSNFVNLTPWDDSDSGFIECSTK